jgi:PAS domain S-box-containing protein
MSADPAVRVVPGPPLHEQMQALRRLALAATRPAGEEIYQELVAEVARALNATLAMVSVFADEQHRTMRTLAIVLDGQPVPESVEYPLEQSPCVEVVGRGYCFMPGGVMARYGVDRMVADLGLDAYAAFPMNDSRGRPLGLVAALDRQAIAGGDADHAEAVLKIAALRLGAELERSAADAALRRSEASYRAIFEAAEDSIFIHDWDSGRFIDVNPKACATYGYTREELLRLTVADVSSGVPPYTAQDALRWMVLAREGRCPPFEWQRRNKDGSLHWDEVRLKPVTIDGRPHVLAVTRDITERKAAEEHLRDQQQRYRAIFDGSADPIVLWNRRLEVVDVNAAFERTTGYARDHIVGRHWSARPDADDLHKLIPMIEGALAGREGRAVERVARADGSLFDIELRYLPMNFGGEPHALGIGRDISQALAAEQALRDSEAQYRAIFNASADVLTLWNSRFQRVDVNPAYERLYGWKREEVIGRGFDFPAYSDDHQQLREQLLRRALAGETVQAEHDVVTRSGERRHAEVTAIPFRHGDEPHVLVITRDITARTRAEARLRDSEEQYRAIFNASADALMLWNSNLERVDVNPAHQKIFGYARKEVVGRAFEGLDWPPEMVQQRLAMIRRALAGEASHTELEALRKDGRRIVTELRTIPFQHRGEAHVLQIARDVTAQRAAETERRALEAQLRQAQKMEAIGQLTGGIAHDFNNILTSVIGYLVLAQERAERSADAALLRQLGSAQAAAQRARELIAQMLAFARRQRGDRRVIALAPVARQGLQLLRSTLPSSIVLDDSALADDTDALPPVRADAVQIEQVLFNLCLNARDAMPRGGRITVRLTEPRDAALRCTSCGSDLGAGRWLRLSVADTGTGIDPAVVSRMFEPFFTTKEVGRGSGMGLAMVHGIVHDHEGHIVVDSAPGGGSHFHVLLPVVDDEIDAPLAAAPVAAGGRRFRGRVMVVEDEPMVAAFMRELLEGWGLEVVAPPDALAALRWFDDPAQQVDLLITDLTMPHLNGLDLAHHVSVLRPQLPVLLYSGDADAVDADALRRAGIAAVLGKPVDPQPLAALLGRWLPAR